MENVAEDTRGKTEIQNVDDIAKFAYTALFFMSHPVMYKLASRLLHDIRLVRPDFVSAESRWLR